MGEEKKSDRVSSSTRVVRADRRSARSPRSSAGQGFQSRDWIRGAGVRSGDVRRGDDSVLVRADGDLLPLRAGRGARDLPRRHLEQGVEEAALLRRLALKRRRSREKWGGGSGPSGGVAGGAGANRARGREETRRAPRVAPPEGTRTASFFTGPDMLAGRAPEARARVENDSGDDDRGLVWPRSGDFFSLAPRGSWPRTPGHRQHWSDLGPGLLDIDNIGQLSASGTPGCSVCKK